MGRPIPQDPPVQPIASTSSIPNPSSSSSSTTTTTNVINNNRLTFSPPISRQAIRSESSSTTRRFTPTLITSSISTESNLNEANINVNNELTVRSLDENSRRELNRRIREQRELLLFGVISNQPDRIQANRVEGDGSTEVTRNVELIRPANLLRRLSVGSASVRNAETEAIMSSARTALRTAVGFAERLEMVTRTLTSIADNVTSPALPSESTALPQSPSSSLQRSLDQLRAASARIDRILIEERTRANDSTNTNNTTPLRSTSDAIRQLRETTSALLISLPPLPSSTPSTNNNSETTLPVRRISSSIPQASWTFSESTDGSNRRRAVYHIVVASTEDTVPASSTPTTNATTIPTSETDDEETINLLRGWGRLDRNGDQILAKDSSEVKFNAKGSERVGR